MTQCKIVEDIFLISLNKERVSSTDGKVNCKSVFASLSSHDEASDSVLSALVNDVASRPGARSLLEKKLVMLANQNNELPADG